MKAVVRGVAIVGVLALAALTLACQVGRPATERSQASHHKFRRPWEFLCDAIAIIHTDRDQTAKVGHELRGLLGINYGTLVATGAAGRGSTQILARRGRARAARDFMIRFAREHDFILLFPNGDRYDPRKHTGSGG